MQLMAIWLYTLASVAAVALIPLLIFLVFPFFRRAHDRETTLLPYLVCLAVGGLLGGAFLHLIPQAIEEANSPLTLSTLILGGVVGFYVLENFLRWRHGHDVVKHEEDKKISANILMIGDAIHNMMDGMLIAASFQASLGLGLTTTVAVVLHEIPQEIGDFGVLLHSGYTVRRALSLNLVTAGLALLGAALSLILGEKIEGYQILLVPFTAGGFIYIAASDLMPTMHRPTRLTAILKQFIVICLGLGIMAALRYLE